MEKESHRTDRKGQRTHVAHGLTVRDDSYDGCVARKGSRLWKQSDLPMNQDPSSTVQPLPDEGIAGGKMLDGIVVLDVIELDDVVLEIEEEMVLKRQVQHGDYVGDIGLVQGLFAAQGEEPVVRRLASGFGLPVVHLIAQESRVCIYSPS